MKKALLIIAAALMTMTQCKKQETSPVTPATDTIKMTVTAGPGRTDINTETGAITWSAGDKLYVSDGAEWLGSLTLVGEGGSSQGTFTGNIAGIDETETTCHFFYLGHDNGMEEPTGTAAANISFASQDGTLAGAMKYHAGYGTTDVKVESGEYQGYVVMNTKIAIAHLDLTTDGTQAYTGSVTMGGTGVSNTLTVSPDGSFSGGDDGGIAIDKGDGTTGERFVTLIPTAGTDRVDVAFTGDATGSMTFLAGIRENKFYGMKDAMKVTVTVTPKPKFSVADGTTVEFSPGNLYWDGSAFKFEADQWETQPTSDGQWVENHVSHFKWSDAAKAVTGDYSYSGELFCASNFTVDGEAGWRTLSEAEWGYLLNTRTNAQSLRAFVTLDNGVSGLVILPDNSTDAASSVTTTALVASSGAVFLPAAGYRSGTDVIGAGSYGYYWSSTPNGDYTNYAYSMSFHSGNAGTDESGRSYGNAVRLVR